MSTMLYLMKKSIIKYRTAFLVSTTENVPNVAFGQFGIFLKWKMRT
jgi:hypothetical protein